ncbi:DUF3124 domain-containing protein [Thermodesulfobacteriota bacterium]
MTILTPSNRLLSVIVLIFCSLLFFIDNTSAHEKLSKGETVYVSIYSNVHTGPKSRPFQLSAVLSIRNTDPQYNITIHLVDYFNTKGKKIEGYIKEAIQLKPLESISFNIGEYDKRGGVGANFIVKWSSKVKVNQPIIEGIMLGTSSQQGISFVCPGRIIEEHN